MAMIKCFECRKKVSSNAHQCPHCGIGLSVETNDQLSATSRRKAEKWQAKAAEIQLAERKAEQGSTVSGIGGLFLICLVLWFIFGGDDDIPSSSSASAASNETTTEYPCTTAFSGEVIGAERAIIRQLKDPGSYDHIGTQVSKTNNVNGEREIIVQYRAKNSFGGFNTGMAVGAYNPNTCDITAIALVE